MRLLPNIEFFVLILFLSLFFGCSCDKPNNYNPPAIELWPLTIENWWRFEIWEIEETIEYTYEELYEVVSVFSHSNYPVAKISLKLFLADSLVGTNYLWWGNTANGLYAYAPIGDAFAPYSSPKLLFKYPAEDGASWQSYVLDESIAEEMVFFTPDYPIETGAGSFLDCAGYSIHRAPSTDYYYYFKPDTGYVRMERYVGGSLIKTRSLLDFGLN